jgi:hypothetical protein
MNAVLLDNAIRYHGRRLREMISNEKIKCSSLPVPPNTNIVAVSDDEDEEEKNRDEADLESHSLDDKSLRDRILNFIAKRSGYLFAAGSQLTGGIGTENNELICLSDEANKASQPQKRKYIGNYLMNEKNK